jgi:hypothetical protein
VASATIFFDFLDMELSPDSRTTVRPRSEKRTGYISTLRRAFWPWKRSRDAIELAAAALARGATVGLWTELRYREKVMGDDVGPRIGTCGGVAA